MSKPHDMVDLIREFSTILLRKDEIAFLYLHYAGVIVRLDDRTVAFDIANLLDSSEIAALRRLDLLLITHSHSDHYNRARTRQLLRETSAHIVAQTQVADDLGSVVSTERLVAAEHSNPVRVHDFHIVAINGVHPRPINMYWIERGRISLFHAGDSGYCPMRNLSAKLAFLPTGRPSPSCSPESALRFAEDLKPRVAVAMHGNRVQMNKFKTLTEKKLPDTTVIVPEKYKIETVHI